MLCSIEDGEQAVAWVTGDDGLFVVCPDHARSGKAVGMKVRLLREFRYIEAFGVWDPEAEEEE